MVDEDTATEFTVRIATEKLEEQAIAGWIEKHEETV